MGQGTVVIIGGGATGLSAAWTLKKRGFKAILLEASHRVGGRLGTDRIDGFTLDYGADFFCNSYDVTFQICEELGLSLIRSEMNLGWYRNGSWARTFPLRSFNDALRNIPGFWKLGLVSPGFFKLARQVQKQTEFLNFSSNSRLAEIDGNESFGEYLARIGVSKDVEYTLRGFLEMTMGHVENSSAGYMRTYFMEMFLNSNKIYVPEKGAGALIQALYNTCSDSVRVSTAVRRVIIEDGVVTNVELDNGPPIEVDAVICTVPATKVAGIVPDLSTEVLQSLGMVTYSSGCRVVIGLDHPPLPPGWHGALYPEDETPLLLDRSINLPACVPPGKHTLDMLVGRDRAKELFPLSDEEIKREMLNAARRNPPPGSNLPGDDEGLFTQVYRWQEAVCMGPPGMFTAMEGMQSRLGQEVKNFFLAGDYMRIPCVNGALASGVDAANQVADMLASQTE